MIRIDYMFKRYLVMFFIGFSLFSCSQISPVLLNWATQLHIIREHDGSILYGLSIEMFFEDVDNQIVEDSFYVHNRARSISWYLEKGIERRVHNKTLILETMILSDSYRDFLEEIEITWRTLFGQTHIEVIQLGRVNVPKGSDIGWDEFIWVSSDRFKDRLYAYDEKNNIGLINIIEQTE